MIAFTIADDPPPLEPPTCTIDGQPCNSSCSFVGSPYVFCSLDDGMHDVVITATDPCGNVGEGSSLWRVDTMGPIITALQTIVLADGAATVAYAASDNASSIFEFVCAVDNQPVNCPFSQTTGTTAAGLTDFAVCALPPGPHVFLIRAIDAWNNMANPVSASFDVPQYPVELCPPD